jgi:hypothetical protein
LVIRSYYSRNAGSSLAERNALLSSSAAFCGAPFGRKKPRNNFVPKQELGVTVVTNLQAALWHALRSVGLNDKIAGYGRLLREL